MGRGVDALTTDNHDNRQAAIDTVRNSRGVAGVQIESQGVGKKMERDREAGKQERRMRAHAPQGQHRHMSNTSVSTVQSCENAEKSGKKTLTPRIICPTA